MLAEGQRAKLEDLVKWCWKGPEGAEEVGIKNRLTAKRKVSNVEVSWLVAKGDQRGKSSF